MESIKFEVRGITPLMLNSTATANPLNEYSKAIKELTSKRTKADTDILEIYHLKFLASLYLNNKMQYIIPANMIMASLVAAAKENKLGVKFKQSVCVYNDALLQFEHKNCTPEELWENHQETYVDLRPVGIKQAKVIASRAIIPEWSFESELFFDETQLNKSEIWLALEIAGKRKGIGTYRDCFGRFEVTEIKDEPKKKKK